MSDCKKELIWKDCGLTTRANVIKCLFSLLSQNITNNSSGETITFIVIKYHALSDSMQPYIVRKSSYNPYLQLYYTHMSSYKILWYVTSDYSRISLLKIPSQTCMKHNTNHWFLILNCIQITVISSNDNQHVYTSEHLKNLEV